MDEDSNPNPRIDSAVEKRTELKLNSDIIIITNLGCSLTKKPQIQVSDY